MPQSDQIRDLQRPPTRSHQTNVTSRKDKKEKREKPKPSKSSQTCPGKKSLVIPYKLYGITYTLVVCK